MEVPKRNLNHRLMKMHDQQIAHSHLPMHDQQWGMLSRDAVLMPETQEEEVEEEDLDEYDHADQDDETPTEYEEFCEPVQCDFDMPIVFLEIPEDRAYMTAKQKEEVQSSMVIMVQPAIRKLVEEIIQNSLQLTEDTPFTAINFLETGFNRVRNRTILARKCRKKTREWTKRASVFTIRKPSNFQNRKWWIKTRIGFYDT